MNKTQELFVSAFAAAQAVAAAPSSPSTPAASAHAAATTTLQTFTAAGHDPQDYGQWQSFYTMVSQQFRHMSFQKTPSEQKAEATAKAAAAEAAKNKPPVAATPTPAPAPLGVPPLGGSAPAPAA